MLLFLLYHPVDFAFYFCAIDDPFVVMILDGNVLRIVLDDNDDFAMLAKNLEKLI